MEAFQPQHLYQGVQVVAEVAEAPRGVHRRRLRVAKAAQVQRDAAKAGWQCQHGFFPEDRRGDIAMHEDHWCIRC